MKKLIIFGNGKIAEVVHYFFKHHSDYSVEAFTVDSEYMQSDVFCKIPVVPFEHIEEHYLPNDYTVFVAIGYQQMNKLRAEKLQEVKSKGYATTSYIHPNSGTPSDLMLGENCFIMNQVNIHPCVKLGHNVFVWSGAMIGHHTTIGDHTWITSSANISGNVTVGSHCFFAVNATIGHGIQLGSACFLGANALVTKGIPDGTVVIAESDKIFRLNSEQFIRFAKFDSI
ncbi:acetyltransferase [uncultured Roseivirga sp.]|uniref:acetyltransferase n=1 Tax=uncultured Roseivirga sp. TaxID=543088 RepID=UPI00258EC7E7|nr:acetyltransferase [uncultured Roseivirga sp.]